MIINNLIVAGSVTAGQHHGSGLVGFAWSGTNTIENCRVSTNVTNTNIETNNYIGGIVGHGKGSTVRILGCVYDGTLHSEGKVGGLLGWSDAGIDLTLSTASSTVMFKTARTTSIPSHSKTEVSLLMEPTSTAIIQKIRPFTIR